MIPRCVETYLPCAVSFVTAGSTLAFAQKLPSVPAELAAATMTLGVVIAGFTATQRNMLVGMKGLPLFKTIARTGHHQDLILYLKQCVWSSVTLVVVSTTRFFLDDAPPEFVQVWGVIWFGTFAFVIASAVRNERLMFQVIGKFLKRHGDPPDSV